jgi:ribose transport system permease protein
MKQLLGITVLLAALYAVLVWVTPESSLSLTNFNLGKRIGLYGIIALGAGILIISGGIDLSIGSVVALSATVTAMLLTGELGYELTPALALPLVLLMGAVIGLINGLLVTKVKIPAFMVTLCGLFIYRGVARTISGNTSKGLGDQFKDLVGTLYTDPVFGVPRILMIFLGLVVLATVFLHLSVYGRYLYAIGSNEKAARYSGIATDRYKILPYVICSTLASLFGIMFLMDNNSVRPSSDGSFYELYAIAAAVLGGCSLRGGQGTVLGIIIGTAILWVLPQLANMLGVSSELQFIVIGGALLLGAILDELLRPRRVVQRSS